LPIFFENCLQSIKECQFSTALVVVLHIYVNLTAELNKLMKERFPQIETDQNSLIPVAAYLVSPPWHSGLPLVSLCAYLVPLSVGTSPAGGFDCNRQNNFSLLDNLF
jgi:hypothetical protein